MLPEADHFQVDNEAAEFLQGKPLWQWRDELDNKHDAKGSIRIVRPFSAADRQCQDEGLQLLPDEQVTDTEGNSNYLIYCRDRSVPSNRDPAIQSINERLTRLTLKVACSVHGLGDRNIARIREEVDELRQELAADRTERQGEIDALTNRFLRTIAEINAAQSVDGCSIASSQADISQLEERLDELEEASEPAPVEAPIKVRVARFALLLVAIAALFVGADQGKIRASITPEGLALLAISGTAFLAHRNLED